MESGSREGEKERSGCTEWKKAIRTLGIFSKEKIRMNTL